MRVDHAASKKYWDPSKTYRSTVKCNLDTITFKREKTRSELAPCHLSTKWIYAISSESFVDVDHHKKPSEMMNDQGADMRPRAWTCMVRCAIYASSQRCTIYHDSRRPRWCEHSWEKNWKFNMYEWLRGARRLLPSSQLQGIS